MHRLGISLDLSLNGVLNVLRMVFHLDILNWLNYLLSFFLFFSRLLLDYDSVFLNLDRRKHMLALGFFDDGTGLCIRLHRLNYVVFWFNQKKSLAAVFTH